MQLAGVDLGAWLSGRWSIRRAINDDPEAFTGDAEFTGEPNGAIRWHEAGRLRLGGYLGNAHRNLVIVPPRPPASWEVRFDDGRHFHYLDLSRGRCEVEHPCGPDLYTGVYEVDADDQLSVSWLVTGPRRRDRISSEYRREAGARA